MTAGESTHIADVMSAAEISHVVWIDDRFENAVGPGKLSPRELAVMLHAAGEKPQHSALAHLDLDQSPEDWADEIERIVDDLPNSAEEILSSMSAQGAVQADDYTTSELDAIITAVKSDKVTVRTLGLNEWNEKQDEVLKSLDRNTLVLVDREFTSAGVTLDEGDNILNTIDARASGAAVVMLTHSVPQTETEARSRTIADKAGVKYGRFALMSKRKENAGGEPVAAHLRRTLRIVLTIRACRMLAEKVAESMRTGVAESLDVLASESIFSLDKAIFGNSLEEGASETDVIVRILLQRQRVHAQRHAAADHESAAELARIRQLRQIEPLRAPEPAFTSSALVEWRRDEVFESGDLINGIHSPIALGDVFEHQSNGRLYLLLAQDCDLMVRPDKSRNACEGIWVQLKPALPGTSAAGADPVTGRHIEGVPNMRYFGLPPLFSEQPDQAYVVDFRVAASVNLEPLEWAVFNPDGKLRLAAAQPAVSFLLPGWAKKLEKWTERFAGIRRDHRNLRLSLSSTLSGGVLEVKNETLEFPYKRVGRIRAPLSSAVFGAYGAFQTRAALDHDFARGLGGATTPDAPAEAVP